MFNYITKKASLFIALALSAFIFNACSSAPSLGAHPGGLDDAPTWVLNPTIEGAISDVGSAPANAGGDFSFQRNQALTDARDNLVRQMKVKVSNMIKTFKASTGTASDGTFDQATEQVSKQIASETLVGSKLKSVWVNKKSGMMHVLVVLDTDSIIEQLDKNIKSSMGNEKAVYQKFLAKKAQDDLSKELEAYTKENN